MIKKLTKRMTKYQLRIRQERIHLRKTNQCIPQEKDILRVKLSKSDKISIWSTLGGAYDLVSR